MKKIINVTPHSLTFQNAKGEVYTVEPCGTVISASPVEEVLGFRLTCEHLPPACKQYKEKGSCESCEHSITLVKTVFLPTEEAEKQLEKIEAENPKAIIVGSIIAAQAFPGRIFAMVPVEGFERVSPEQKRMRDDKFTTF